MTPGWRCWFVALCCAGVAGSLGANTVESVAEARGKWPFKGPGRVEIPEVRAADWTENELDRFVLAKLEEQGLRPAARAEKRALIRRATFDLTGLPPMPEEVRAFLEDESAGAFARVVDRLLASAAYGERWGRHWLDVVRYTDSFDARGLGGEGDVPEAYRYRDWVVKAFNDDLPYDEFVRRQIAGDILAARGDEFDTNALVATGVYVIGEWGTGDADKEKMLTDIVDDQIDLTGRAFLGLTLACARCHDHKFDPISTEDYYGMAGIFFSSHILPNPGAKTAGSPVSRVPMAAPKEIARRKGVEERIAATGKEIESRLVEEIRRFAVGSLPETALILEALWDWREDGGGTIEEVAKRRNLNAAQLRAWRDLLGWEEGAALTKLRETVAGKKGVDAWVMESGSDTPSVTINSTVEDVGITTLTLPAQSVSVHPAPKSGVAVVWLNPVDGPAEGRVMVEMELKDSDDKCGDGFEWALMQREGRSATEIQGGKVGNGGEAKLMEEVEVAKGAALEVVIGPRGGHACDTTTVWLRIAEVGGEKREWDLAKDMLAAAGSVPVSDRYGNAGVWSFRSAGGAPKFELASSSGLQKWMAAGDNDARASAAVELQRGLLAAANGGTNQIELKLFNAFADAKGVIWNGVRENLEFISKEFAVEIARLREREGSLRAELGPAFPVTHALQEGGTPESAHAGFKDARVHVRGRYDRLGDVVPRRFPAVLAETLPKIPDGASGRLELADWIASGENPLTARVMVNRIWQHHFGEGIVRTPNNFGKLGQPPTHSKLLGFLAMKFVENGWSMKKMHRLIMLSATYQQATVPRPETLEKDADNLLWGRQNRRRLEAEAIRDSLLAVAGDLDLRQGGKAIRDLETARRTMYVMTVRSDRATYQSLFDAADPASIVEKRIDSTVAPQALFLLNHPLVLKAAEELAGRLNAISQEQKKRIEWLYELLYARPPNGEEMQLGLAMVLNGEWADYCHVLLAANEFVYVD